MFLVKFLKKRWNAHLYFLCTPSLPSHQKYVINYLAILHIPPKKPKRNRISDMKDIRHAKFHIGTKNIISETFVGHILFLEQKQ